MANLSISSKSLAYSDTVSNSNPKLRHFDWYRTVSDVECDNPDFRSYQLAAGETLTIFDTSRSTSIDGTTAFNLTLNPTDTTVYRFTRSAGTLPAFRTDRGLSLSGVAITVALGANASATFTLPSGASSWGTLAAGDIVFIPGTATGDSASPFNALNVGWWTVLQVVGKVLTLVRPDGEVFSAYAEVVTLSAATQIVGFSATGVQITDKMDITAGFATGTRKTYEIVAVTPTWVEVTSTTALATESGIIPGVAGIAFYSGAKRYLRVEVDQECFVRMNGETTSTVKVSPIVAGDPDQPGWMDKFGLVWKLVLVNASTTTLNAVILGAE